VTTPPFGRRRPGRRRHLAALLALAAVAAPASAFPGAYSAQAATASGAAFTATDTDTPGLVEGLAEPVDATAPADRAARAHLRSHPDRYAIADATLVTASVESEDGREVVRLDQTYRDLPVVGGQYVVRMTKADGKRTVTGTSGKYFTELSVDTAAPELDAATAVDRAVRAVEASLTERGRGTSVAGLREPDLTGSDRGLAVLPTGTGVLARHVTVRGADPATGLPVLQQVYVHAASGLPLLQYSDIRTPAAPGVLESVAGPATSAAPAADEPRPSGTGVTPVTGTGVKLDGTTVPVGLQRIDAAGVYLMQDLRDAFAPTVTPIVTLDAAGIPYEHLQEDPEAVSSRVPFVSPSATLGADLTAVGAVDAHWAAGEVYDYYATNLGRNSLDGEGMAIRSIVGATSWGSPWVNAYWDAEQAVMVYGTGYGQVRSLASDTDVVGHEMTHGVVQHTANLVYAGQSGAVNEAIADYFGNAIDVESSGTAMDDPEAGLVGGDLCIDLAPVDCAFRDLNDGRTTDDFFSLPFGYLYDNGGVHENATIVGGALWDVREALGGERADEVVYRALAGYLTPLAGFTDTRDAVVAAARELGVNGRDLAAVRAAFDSRGIVKGWEDKRLGVDSTTLLGRLATQHVAVGTGPAPSVGGGWFAVSRSNAPDGTTPAAIWVGTTDGKVAPRQLSPDDGRFHTSAVTDGKTVAWVAAGETFDILVAPITGGTPRTLASLAVEPTGLGVDGGTVAWSDWFHLYYLTDLPKAGTAVEPRQVELGYEWDQVHSLDVRDGRIAFIHQHNEASPYPTGLTIFDTRTGTSVAAGESRPVNWTGEPVLTPSAVFWLVDEISDEQNDGMYRNDFSALRRANLDGSNVTDVLREVTDELRGWGLTASDTTVTMEVTPPRESYAGLGNTNAIWPELRQYTYDGDALGRVSCNAGAQWYPAADAGRAVVWVDSTTTDFDLVTGRRAQGGCE
jgi:Zn-dependent metalloprotease